VGLVGKNAALTAIPFGITALTYQQTSAAVKNSTSDPIAALQLALTLEYLENEFLPVV
jgi:hypothetical protein